MKSEELKKQYVKPCVEVIKTEAAQVICASGGYDPDAMP